MPIMQSFLTHLWEVTLEASPWLLVGLVISGLIKVWMPTALLRRWLGGRGGWPVVNAAILGTPLPLCSCSVVPAAVTLRRAGATKGATVSFLVATPENGADSIALSYALLGPFMTIVRPVAAILSAITAGLLTMAFARDEPSVPTPQTPESCGSCCGSGCGEPAAEPTADTFFDKARAAMHYATGDLYRDIAGWLALGLVLAAVMNTFIEPGTMASWGSGLFAMLVMVAIGVPMYICATASTPVAAAMLIAGVSPGTVLVFLLAGPATNLGTIGIVRRELGNAACITYLTGAAGGAIVLGLLTDGLVNVAGISVAAQTAEHQDLVPTWLAVTALAFLLLMTVRLLIPRPNPKGG